MGRSAIGDIGCRLVCLDMAGTTVVDDGTVVRAVGEALVGAGLRAGSREHSAAIEFAEDTMGQSKIAVFLELFPGDEDRAHRANAEFERAYHRAIVTGGIRAVAGAAEAIESLRAAGHHVVLTTGLAPVTREAVIAALGWKSMVSFCLSPVDAGRGRPYPDMLLSAVLRSRIDSVADLVAVGDTTSDLLAGDRAGAGMVVAVRSGAHSEADFATVPHTHVLESVADLPGAIARDDRARG